MKVTAKQYAQALFDLTDGKSEQEVSIATSAFASQLKKDGQMKNAPQILGTFSAIFNKQHGIAVVHVTSSREMPHSDLEKVKEFVKTKYGAKEIEMSVAVDKKLQGGIIIRVGDEIFDGSVSAQLKKLKNILSK